MPEMMFGPPPPTRLEVVPSPHEIRSFQENGFLALDRITTDEEIDWLHRIFDHIFDPANVGQPGGPVDRSGKRIPEAAGKLTQSFFPELQFPEVLETNFVRNARRYAAALLGQPEDRLGAWGHMIKKSPGGPAAPWHQDHGYWQPEFDYCALGVWLPLQDVSVEMGAMQFIPGSHKLGLLPHRHVEEPADNVLVVADHPNVDLSSAVACPLKKGGCTFHHSETLHHTAPNVTDRPRLAFPMEFQLKPLRRSTPKRMPWVDEERAASGRRENPTYVADGQVLTI